MTRNESSALIRTSNVTVPDAFHLGRALVLGADVGAVRLVARRAGDIAADRVGDLRVVVEEILGLILVAAGVGAANGDEGEQGGGDENPAHVGRD